LFEFLTISPLFSSLVHQSSLNWSFLEQREWSNKFENTDKYHPISFIGPTGISSLVFCSAGWWKKIENTHKYHPVLSG